MFSAKASSASVTRLCCSRRASASSSARSSRPATSRVPFRKRPGAAHGQHLAVADLLEEVGAGRVDQADAAADEQQRAGVRKSAGLRLGDVDDDADAGLQQLLGRDAVEVGVVDDRDVVGREAADEMLRPPVEPRCACVLDEAHLTVERNSRPPSIRSSSSRRSSSSSASIARVRGIAGHLLDAEVPVGDARDLRQVRDRDDLRALAEPPQRLRDRVGRLRRRFRRRSRRRRASSCRRPPRRSRARSGTARRRTPSRRRARTAGRRSGRIRNAPCRRR